MGDSSEINSFPSDKINSEIEDNINSHHDSATEKNTDKLLTQINNLDNDKQEKESSNLSSQFNDVDLATNSIISDQAIKLKSKFLESETEQRNTSTSNAGESEYESANEEDIDDFENTPDTGIFTESSKINSESNLKVECENINNNNQKDEAYDKSQTVDGLTKTGDFSSLNEVDEEHAEHQVLSQIRRRKKRSNVSDDENIDEESDHVSDEEESFDVDDEEDSYDEAKGDIILTKSHEDVNMLPVDERENGDGQESENQDNKSSKASLSKVTKKNEPEDKRNPQYIPRKGPFYEHDDRINEVIAKPQEPAKAFGESDDLESEKAKSKKRLMASMKLRSDDMIDDDLDADHLSSKSVSKEKIHDVSSQSVESLEKAVHNVKVDSKSPREPKKKPLWDSKDRWNHDKFDVDDQKPKSREELINTYGYDIRNENEAPKSQRRSRYGKGPQRYSRRSEDESAYAKKALRKVIIRPSRTSFSEDSKDSKESDSVYSTTVVKKDQVFNNKHLPKERDHKVNSRENAFSKPTVSKSNNFVDSPIRVHENRVFVNKQTGPTSKYSKHDKSRSILENSKPNENMELRRDNDNDQEMNEKANELFTNEDFPELVSSAKTQVDGDKNYKGIIYYQNSLPTKSNNDIKPYKDTQQPTNTSSDVKEFTVNSDTVKPNQSMPVVKSQLYENSRLSRSRNYAPNHEYNANWNNRSVNSNKSSQFVSNHQIKKQQSPNINTSKDEVILNESNEMNNDSRPKRYSSIRQQQQRNLTVPSNTTQSTTFTSESQTATVTTSPSQQYVTLNSDGTSSKIISSEVNSKTSYYDPSTVNTNEISHGQNPGLISSGTNHHHATHAHTYTTINGPTTGGTATGTTYIPAATPLMAYYDPNTANGQPAGSTTSALQAPIGLTQAYFTTDQTGTAQSAPNYYLTTADHLTVAYHPAYHLQTNYPQPLTSHHTHQSHVANRYLNTTPANAPSAESNRYLQTAPPTATSTPILVAGQPYQPTIQTAFPSGYPQFPPPQTGATPAIGTSSPLPAGYPNVPMGNSSTNTSVASTQQQTPSGYPELYRGGITYYDIQSQQQAMQRQLQQNVTQQQPRRNKAVNHQTGSNDSNDHADSGESARVEVAGKNSKHSTAKSEISVSN